MRHSGCFGRYAPVAQMATGCVRVQVVVTDVPSHLDSQQNAA
jgi:hypothetical protein